MTHEDKLFKYDTYSKFLKNTFITKIKKGILPSQSSSIDCTDGGDAIGGFTTLVVAEADDGAGDVSIIIIIDDDVALLPPPLPFALLLLLLPLLL